MTFFGPGWAEFHGGKVPGKSVGVTTTVRCMLALCWLFLDLFWPYVAPMLALPGPYVGLMVAYVGAMLALCWSMFVPC